MYKSFKSSILEMNIKYTLNILSFLLKVSNWNWNYGSSCYLFQMICFHYILWKSWNWYQTHCILSALYYLSSLCLVFLCPYCIFHEYLLHKDFSRLFLMCFSDFNSIILFQEISEVSLSFPSLEEFSAKNVRCQISFIHRKYRIWMCVSISITKRSWGTAFPNVWSELLLKL